MEELFINLFGKPEGIIINQLISACRFTIYLSLIAFLGGGVVGSLIVLMRIVPNNILNYISFIYTWLFQSVPLLMLLFLIGLGVPRLLGFDINPWIAATISLILFTSAYLSEVWRGSIQAVSNGQWEAANSLNLNFFQTLKLIILPQAIKFSVCLLYTSPSPRD